jgi:hypothetical protein
MTPLGRTFARFTSILLAALLVAPAIAPARAGAATRTPHETIAYVPAAIWGEYLDAATGGLKLTPHAIYWFDGSDAMGRILGDLERYQADDAKAAPREPLVAFVGRYAADPSNTLMPGVAVMDTAGALVADFPRATSYAWNPDGTRLVVVSPRELAPRGRARRGRAPRASAPRYRPGITVWDRRDNSVRSFPQWPSRAAWAGNDSLLLQLTDRVLVLDPRSGATSASAHNGALVSPDSRYALWPGEGGENTRVFREESGARVTDALFGSFQDRGLAQIRSAFWVRGRGADHLMCVSACDGIQNERPRCRTELIDAETLETLDSFPGEALGPTADERGAIVFRRSRGGLEFHDLRPAVRERAEAGSRRERSVDDDARSRREPAVDVPDSGPDEPGTFH